MRASLDFRAPEFVPAPGGRFALARAWRVVYRCETYAVPAGFVTDGASSVQCKDGVCSPIQ